MTIEYDGTNFCGWQRQPNQRSVQGELEGALSKVSAQPIQINGASRTDAGVHAYGQRANFKADFAIPVDRIQLAVNNLLSNSGIRIRETKEVSLDFHARYNAVGKKYIYRIRNSNEPCIFERNNVYNITKPLNLKFMKEAAKDIVGTHDFKCFQAAGGKELETTVRTILGLKLYEEELESRHGDCMEKEIIVEILGDGFLYNMVRIMIGTLVGVGLGKLDPTQIPRIIESKNRQMAGHTAPPQGLYLAEVYYNKEEMYEKCKGVS